MSKVLIVAEIGANHLGDYDRAEQLIHAAKAVGADAVKFQTLVPAEIAADVLVTVGPWAGRNYRELYRECEMPWAWHANLFYLTRSLGMIPFSAPFSEAAVKRLETIGCPMYKIASPEIVHHPLIAAAARTGKPLVISTGMATPHEIIQAKQVAQSNGATDITFLHCVSNYPADPADYNLQTLHWFEFAKLKFGLSDHTLGSLTAVMAIALGATIIEKHFALSRADGGPDAAFSLEPAEFADLVNQCRSAEEAMAKDSFDRSDTASHEYRRSIWIVHDVEEGEVIQEHHLAILRPDYGLEPRHWYNVLGKKAARSLPSGSPLLWNDLT